MLSGRPSGGRIGRRAFGMGSETPSARSRIPLWLVFVVAGLLFGVAATGEYALRATRSRMTSDPAHAALASAERAVQRAPDDAEARLSLGYAYQRVGRYSDALKEYERILAVDPKALAARYNSGVVLFELGRAEEGEKVLISLLEDAPTHVMAAKTLGEHYVETGRYAEALDVLAPAIAASPGYVDLQYLAGLSAEKLGRDDQAAAYYRGALSYAPHLAEAQEGLARLGVAEVSE